MHNLRKWTRATLVLVAASSIATWAQTFDVLVKFDGTNGANPGSISLVQGFDGNIYGTTSDGGANNAGTVFKAGKGGLKVLYSFCAQSGCADGSFPESTLLLGNDGNFFGMTYNGGGGTCNGGCGTIFTITRDGALTTIHSFGSTDGAGPSGPLLQATDGWLYGVTVYGGDVTCNPPYGCGTLFRIKPEGSLKVLVRFHARNGAQPVGGLVQASDGNLYGATVSGGSLGQGTFYKITPDGKLTTLYDFGAESALPYSAIIQAADGDFYGTTLAGPRGVMATAPCLGSAPRERSRLCSLLTCLTALTSPVLWFKLWMGTSMEQRN